MTIEQVARAAKRAALARQRDETARAELERAIRDARAAGLTFQAIGDAAGLTRARIFQIVSKAL